MSASPTSAHRKLASILRQFAYLWSFQRAGAAKDIAQMVEEAKQLCITLEKNYGFVAENKDVLEIGPGQFLTQARYFALKNRVTAMDYDVIAEYLTPFNVAKMLKRNGSSRTLKTCLRKATGIDHIYRKTTRAQLNIKKLPKLTIEHGDAQSMPFADNSFDMIQSRSVIHQLPHPKKALSEIARVLRPGGVAHLDLHLYTSYNGALDPRTMSGTDTTYYWSHLKHPEQYVQVATLNKWRLHDWRALFAGTLPGAIVRITEDGENIRQALLAQQSKGELATHSTEELMGHALDILWQKPLQPSATR
jgi:SAM-dependent methyltransferase